MRRRCCVWALMALLDSCAVPMVAVVPQQRDVDGNGNLDLDEFGLALIDFGVRIKERLKRALMGTIGDRKTLTVTKVSGLLGKSLTPHEEQHESSWQAAPSRSPPNRRQPAGFHLV